MAAHDFLVVKEVKLRVHQAPRTEFKSMRLEPRLLCRRQLPRVGHWHGAVLEIGTDPWRVAAVLVTLHEGFAVAIKRMLSGRAQIENRDAPGCIGRCGGYRCHDAHSYISC